MGSRRIAELIYRNKRSQSQNRPPRTMRSSLPIRHRLRGIDRRLPAAAFPRLAHMTMAARLAATAALWTVAPPMCAAANVYASMEADGSMRYATQALDSSYRLVFREDGEPIRNAAPGRTRSGGPAAEKLRPMIDRIARRHGVDASLVHAVIAVESGYRTDAKSAKGAQGAMQLMPDTAKRYGLSDSRALRDPERNIDAGVRHLKALLARHNGNTPLALAAYSAGSRAVERHGNRIPPYSETMLYVPAVLAKSR